MQRLPIPLHSAEARGSIATQEALVNWHAELVDRSRLTREQRYKSRFKLLPTPGAQEAANMPIPAHAPGPVQALHYFNDSLYMWLPGGLYRHNTDGNGFERVAGTHLERGRRPSVDISALEMAWVDGRGGAIIDRNGRSSNIDFGDQATPHSVVHLDNYFVFANDRQFFISQLLDGTALRPEDFASAEESPDKIVALSHNFKYLYVIGEKTIELWNNTGGPDFPFTRPNYSVIQRGTAFRETVVRLEDGIIFWVGDDRRVYAVSAYRPQIVSTHAVERDLQNAESASAWAYTEEGHWFYVLNIPGKTWCYDTTTQSWHNRRFHVKHDSQSSWFTISSQAQGQPPVVADDIRQKLYSLSLDSTMDDGRPVIRTAILPPFEHRRRRLFFRELEIELDTGIAPRADSDQSISLSWSDDNGHTFTPPIRQTLPAEGGYSQRVMFRRLGYGRQRTFRLDLSATAPYTIINIWAHVEIGDD